MFLCIKVNLQTEPFKKQILVSSQFLGVRNLESAQPGGLAQAVLGGFSHGAGWGCGSLKAHLGLGCLLLVRPDLRPSESMLVVGRGCGSSGQDLATGLPLGP